jgi:hypothetical protein
MTQAHRLCVLLGADFSGKSSVLRAIRQSTDWQVVSYDDEHVPAHYDFVRRLKPELMNHILPAAASLSPDLVIAWLHVGVLYLRDLSLELRERGNVIVDSYAYKLLSKCVLKGYAEHPIVRSWRDLPPPDEVILLETPAEHLASRVPSFEQLNPLEHYGDKPTREGFLRFQSDLEAEMRRATAGLPVRAISADAPREVLAQTVCDLLCASSKKT